MKSTLHRIGILAGTMALFAGLALPASLAADKPQTLTGQVSDAMCGAKHMMEGSDADCTAACVSKGSKYALVVGDKVYTLDTTDKAALASLAKLAGAKAKVTGTVNGDEVAVSSVSASK